MEWVVGIVWNSQEAQRLLHPGFWSKFFRNIVDVNHADFDGNTPLIAASINGKIETVTLLIENGADVNQDNNYGNTPLILASLRGHTETAKLLIKNGAIVNKVNNHGNTPLISASLKGHTETIKLLIENGADVNKDDNNAHSLVITALKTGQTETAQLLIEKGADVSIPDNEGETPLAWALYEGHLELAKVLIEKGADVNDVYDYNDDTPLLIALKEGHTELAKILIEKRADVNESDAEKNTPLIMVAREGNVELAKILIEKGADVNQANKYGETPLFMALGHTKLAKILIEKGADVNQADIFGNTPLSWASSQGYTEIAEILTKVGAENLPAAPKKHLHDISTSEDISQYSGKGILIGVDFLPSEDHIQSLVEGGHIPSSLNGVIPFILRHDTNDHETLKQLGSLLVESPEVDGGCGLKSNDYEMSIVEGFDRNYIIALVKNQKSSIEIIDSPNANTIGGNFLIEGINGDTYSKDTKTDGKEYEIWQGASKNAAIEFLRNIPQNLIPSLYYVVVETPEGTFGKDLKGMFNESTGEDIV